MFFQKPSAKNKSTACKIVAVKSNKSDRLCLNDWLKPGKNALEKAGFNFLLTVYSETSLPFETAFKTCRIAGAKMILAKSSIKKLTPAQPMNTKYKRLEPSATKLAEITPFKMVSAPKINSPVLTIGAVMAAAKMAMY